MPPNSTRGIFVIPAVAIVLLVGAISWRAFSGSIFAEKSNSVAVAHADVVAASAAATTDFNVGTSSEIISSNNQSQGTSTGLTDLGNNIVQSIANAYNTLAQSGTINQDTISETGKSLSKTITPEIQTKIFTADDVSITIDTSVTRVLQYRADLRDMPEGGVLFTGARRA